jgi:two-component system NtrC family sensor kinase
VLSSSLEAVKAQCSLQRIEIATELPPGPWRVHGDDTRLRQAFDNLLRNAIEAQPRGGLIKVSGQCVKGQVILRFADGGPGVPPEKRATLFDFGQTTKPGGSGIGLPLSQLIVEAHGGNLDYEADVGLTSGATFRLTLPLSQSAS